MIFRLLLLVLVICIGVLIGTALKAGAEPESPSRSSCFDPSCF